MVDIKSYAHHGHTYYIIETDGAVVLGTAAGDTHAINGEIEVYHNKFGTITEIIKLDDACDLLVISIDGYGGRDRVMVYPEDMPNPPETVCVVKHNGYVTGFDANPPLIELPDLVIPAVTPKDTIEVINGIYKTIVNAGFISAEVEVIDKNGCTHKFNYRSPNLEVNK